MRRDAPPASASGSEDPLAEVLVCAYASALQSYRRGTVAKPLPPGIEGTEDGRALSDLERLAHSGEAGPLTAWLRGLDRRYRPTAVRVGISAPQDERIEWLRANLPLYTDASGRPRGELPDLVIELEDVGAAAGTASGGSRVLAYHGTPAENLHSILYSGLRSYSGTRHERNGSIFGDGVYLTRDPQVAFSFTTAPLHGWAKSRLFPKGSFRAVLACSVPAGSRGGTEVTAGSGGASGSPTDYIVVPEGSILARYILLYVEHQHAHAPDTVAGGLPFRLAAEHVYLFWLLVLLGIWLARNGGLQQWLVLDWFEEVFGISLG